jgi:glycosyltransferase involved in cell wall biosynthesis
VSVVIPAYNSAAFLAEALDSVLGQTRAIGEVVVVDDGSTDQTPAVAASYESAGVRYVRQQNNGPSEARNTGIRETSGDLVAFLDADDIWLPDKVEKQVGYLEAHPEVDLVSGDLWFWRVDANVRRLMKTGFRHGSNPKHEVAVRNVVGNTSAVMVRRVALEAVGGFDPALRYGEDWDLWIRLVERSGVGFLHQPVIVYRWHSDSSSYFRDWARFTVLSELSRRAIRRTQPAWWRPILHARRIGYIESQRTSFATWTHMRRWKQIRHAAAAVLAYPFDDTVARLKALFHACVGDAFFWWLHRLTRPPRGSGRASQ